MEIQQIPAFVDNYFWLIHNGKDAIIVDPGDATPVQNFLQQRQLNLCAILVTHHHADHIGGIGKLLANASTDFNNGAVPGNSSQTSISRSLPVYGPLFDQKTGRIPTITHGCSQGDSIFIPELNLYFDVIDVPGHTKSHIAFYCAGLNSLFCGDTLFAGGCGRLFEGTPAQMVDSLQKIAILPANTRVYCAHEYTLSNLRFALTVEPNNETLRTRYAQVCAVREKGLPTVPSELGLELQTNPFLRVASPEIIGTLQSHNKLTGPIDELSVFTAVRRWKDHF
ncbi:MAG: gloB [Solimicrobium sp.]|jgi:hydroxyacylglutathione hydrolase|nr:gloB [Solimicrobium sp.]